MKNISYLSQLWSKIEEIQIFDFYHAWHGIGFKKPSQATVPLRCLLTLVSPLSGCLGQGGGNRYWSPGTGTFPEQRRY